MEYLNNKRFFLFIVLNSFLILIWIVYLFAVQVLDPYGFERRRQVRYTPAKELDIPVRGYIYDRNEELLVRTVKFYQIDYDRSFILRAYEEQGEEKVREVYSKLTEIISNNSALSYNYVYRRLLNAPGTSGVYLSDRIREADYLAIKRELQKNNLDKGFISKFSFQRRSYPKDRLAARLIGVVRETRDQGTVNRENDSTLSRLEGLSGIEHKYNNELKGVYGWRKLLYDAWKRPILIPNLGKQRVLDGHNVKLTIDSQIQEIVEMNLREGLKEFEAQNAIGIFLNPQTGEIVAMASVAANDKDLTNTELRGLPNMAVSFMFEPGSTIKPFTALAAIEKNLYATNDSIDCRTYRLPGRTIRDTHKFEELTFRDVIVKSSNVGTSKIAEKLGEKNLYDKLTMFGFGNRTGSDIYGESAGLFRNLRDWQGFSLHSISFGQEMSVTPIQLAMAYGALANEGVMMRPYLVKEVFDRQNNTVKKYKPQRIRKVSSKTAIDTLATILRDVVTYGTGTAANLSYLSIAGKTGTAEKSDNVMQGYAEGKYIANFAGYFPAEQPQMVGVIIYDEPDHYFRYASMSAVATFRKIAEQMISLPGNELRVASLGLRAEEFVTVPEVTGKTVSEAKNILESRSIKLMVIGDYDSKTDKDKAIVVNQYPKQGVELESGRQVILVTGNEHADSGSRIDSDTDIMPNLTGMTLRRAVRKAKENNVHLIIKGRGVITSQSIKAGSNINFGAECIVRAH